MTSLVELGCVRTVNPDNAILPVCRVDTQHGTVKFIGTAFFFSPRPAVLSVAHVLGVRPEPGEIIAVPRREPPDAEPGVAKRQLWFAPVVNVRADPRHDLAVADVPGVTHFEHFRLQRDDPPGARTLLTYDLASRVDLERQESGDVLPTITPYTWKGYLHGVLVAQEPGMRAPAKILEVSIPVIEGMSGAPLVDERTLSVAGVLFGNVARSLAPAPQSIKDGERWYLPVGRALHWSHARDLLSSLGEAA